MVVRLGRIYDDPAPADGARVLVDRLWPRGMSKERAQLQHWYKAVAPSTELRTWYHHDPALFDEFAQRYRAELDEPDRAAAFQELCRLDERGTLTLLTATRDIERSEAAVLADLIRRNNAPG